MKLRLKIILTLGLVYVIVLPFVYLQVSSLLLEFGESQMKRQAKSFTMMLGGEVEKALHVKSKKKFKKINSILKRALKISHKTKNFHVDKIILINSNFKVVSGVPKKTIGVDFSSHNDVREAFEDKKLSLEIEHEKDEEGEIEADIDVVTFLAYKNKHYVMELKLDFTENVSLLKKQFQKINISAGIVFAIMLALLMVAILIILNNNVIKRVQRFSNAMEKVGEGDLEQAISLKTKDEFGNMASVFNSMLHGLKEKLHMSDYLSDATKQAVSKKASSHEAHKAQRKSLVIFFSDLRGFTSYSENKDPELVVEMLNKSLSFQTKIIREYNGDVDKFVGDEIMAIFNDPLDALKASMAIQAFEFEGQNDSPEIGIGIHSGEVIQGDIGTDNVKDFTVIGDVVNTAARLQSIAKGKEIVISENIKAQVDSSELKLKFESREVTVKGKAQAMTVYSVSI